MKVSIALNIIIATAVLLSLTACKSNTEPIIYDTSIDTLDKEGQLIFQLLENGNLAQAEEQLTENLKLFPGNIELLNLQAWLFLVRGEYDEAEARFIDILDKKETNPLACAAMARIERIRGNRDSALEWIRKGIVLRSSISVLWLEKGILNYEIQEYKQALLDFNKAVLLDRNSMDALFFKYVTMLKLGREVDEVKQNWETILQKQAAREWYFLYHAVTLHELGNSELAMQVTETGLFNYPDDPWLLNLNAWLLYEQYRRSPDTQLILKARQNIERCLNTGTVLVPEFVDTLFTILFEQGETDRIEQDLDRYLLLMPDSELLYDWQKRIQELP
jgi:tetratricopeptide (TPR) repeat protein